MGKLRRRYEDRRRVSVHRQASCGPDSGNACGRHGIGPETRLNHSVHQPVEALGQEYHGSRSRFGRASKESKTLRFTHLSPCLSSLTAIFKEILVGPVGILLLLFRFVVSSGSALTASVLLRFARSQSWEKFQRRHDNLSPHDAYVRHFIGAENGPEWRKTRALFDRTFTVCPWLRFGLLVTYADHSNLARPLPSGNTLRF